MSCLEAKSIRAVADVSAKFLIYQMRRATGISLNVSVPSCELFSIKSIERWLDKAGNRPRCGEHIRNNLDGSDEMVLERGGIAQ